jgi:hypothetical protein
MTPKHKAGMLPSKVKKPAPQLPDQVLEYSEQAFTNSEYRELATKEETKRA